MDDNFSFANNTKGSIEESERKIGKKDDQNTIYKFFDLIKLVQDYENK